LGFSFEVPVHVTAIVPAAGSGVRFGGVVPKQYLPLAGRPLLAWTLKALAASGQVDCTILAVAAGQEARFRAEILEPNGLRVDHVVPGGADRQASVCAGLSKAPVDTDLVLVHDGARPLITAQIMRAVIAAACADGAAVVAIPVTDTIKAADAECRVEDTLPRGRLWAAQTPQVFRAAWLREAHARALTDGFRGTDDSVLVERLGYPVRLVPGSSDNLKITTMADLAQAEQILRGRMTNDRQMTNDQ
jgi:2-C-methyl-D-erythritol 4-phosphate cytidylyltransferase